MMRFSHLPAGCKKIGTCVGGSALVEAAAVFPFMLIALIGIIGLSQYTDATHRLSQVANQTGIALSMEEADNPTYRSDLLALSAISGRPSDVAVSYIYCKADSSGVPQPTAMTGSAGKGSCNYSGSAGGTYTQAATCPAASPGVGFDQFVVVVTSCQYHPVFNAFGLIDSNISSRVEVPVRKGFL